MSDSCLIKIYLPEEAKGKFLYGKRQILSSQTETVNYFVISCVNEIVRNTDLELLGTLSNEVILHDGISLLKDQAGKIVKVLLNSQEVSSNHRVLLLRFKKSDFLKSFDDEYNPKSIEENFALIIAKALKDEHAKENGKSFVSKVMNSSHSFLASFSSVASTAVLPFASIFKNTVIYQHCSNWQKCLNNDTKNGFFVLDILLGILFFLLMSHVQHSCRYFMESTEFIVNKLRMLLEMLDGSPVGLKLNVQLNNFLLSCFMYHVGKLQILFERNL